MDYAAYLLGWSEALNNIEKILQVRITGIDSSGMPQLIDLTTNVESVESEPRFSPTLVGLPVSTSAIPVDIDILRTSMKEVVFPIFPDLYCVDLRDSSKILPVLISLNLSKSKDDVLNTARFIITAANLITFTTLEVLNQLSLINDCVEYWGDRILPESTSKVSKLLWDLWDGGPLELAKFAVTRCYSSVDEKLVYSNSLKSKLLRQLGVMMTLCSLLSSPVSKTRDDLVDNSFIIFHELHTLYSSLLPDSEEGVLDTTMNSPFTSTSQGINLSSTSSRLSSTNFTLYHYHHSIIIHRERVNKEISQILSLCRPRPLWQQNWGRQLVFSVGSALLIRHLYKNRSDLEASLRLAWDSSRDFYEERVLVPVRSMLSEIFARPPRTQTDIALQTARRELRAMLHSLASTMESRKFSLSEDLRTQDLHYLADNLDMTLCSDMFALEARTPIRSSVSGDLLQVLLTQISFLKYESVQALQQIDTILASNHFNLQIVSSIPALFVASALGTLGSRAWGFLVAGSDFSALRKKRQNLRLKLATQTRDFELVSTQLSHSLVYNDKNNGSNQNQNMLRVLYDPIYSLSIGGLYLSCFEFLNTSFSLWSQERPISSARTSLGFRRALSAASKSVYVQNTNDFYLSKIIPLFSLHSSTSSNPTNGDRNGFRSGTQSKTDEKGAGVVLRSPNPTRHRSSVSMSNSLRSVDSRDSSHSQLSNKERRASGFGVSVDAANDFSMKSALSSRRSGIWVIVNARALEDLCLIADKALFE